MTIKIKTTLITLEVTDKPHTTGYDYTRHKLPDETMVAVKDAVTEAIRLHNEVKK